MSKIVFLGAPAYGHVNPTLPVVQELVQRGEQVIYFNTEEFRAQIERTGAIFRAYPDAISSAEISTALQDGKLANITALIMRATQHLLPFLLDELPRERPDLLIFDSMALWGKMAATLLNVRAASSVSHFVIDLLTGDIGLTGRELWRNFLQILPTIPEFVIARVRLVRRYGKAAFPSDRPLFPMRGGLNIIFTSRELHPDTPIINDTFRFVGPSINPQTRADDFSFDRLREGKVIYISLGTIHHAQTEFYRECFKAFADYPAQFILSVGRETNIQALGTMPSNFIVRPSVPQLEVLQHVDAFITHGGMNSIHEGLYYGVPLILIPHQLEQLINARCVVKQGAGLVISKQVAGEPVAAADLRRALDEILSESRYQEAAARVQQTLRATGGYRRAADEIQAYLAKG